MSIIANVIDAVHRATPLFLQRNVLDKRHFIHLSSTAYPKKPISHYFWAVIVQNRVLFLFAVSPLISAILLYAWYTAWRMTVNTFLSHLKIFRQSCYTLLPLNHCPVRHCCALHFTALAPNVSLLKFMGKTILIVPIWKPCFVVCSQEHVFTSWHTQVKHLKPPLCHCVKCTVTRQGPDDYNEPHLPHVFELIRTGSM